MVSIHTIKGIRTGGVPWGTRWANICCVLLIHRKIINLRPNHNGRASDNVIDKCLVLVNTHWNNPRKLLNRIIENNEMKMNDLPFKNIFITN